MARTKYRNFTTSDFRDFISAPVSLNGALEWTPNWVVEMLLQKKGFNILGGAQKVGKSLLRSHLLVCAIAQRPALDFYDIEPVEKALLLAGEEALEVEEARIRRAARGIGLDEQELPIYIMEQRHGFFFDDYDSFEEFVNFVAEERFDLVVIDPLIRWHRVDENVAGQLAPILTNLRLIRELATLLVVHHTSKPHKDQSEYALGHLLRGSGDLAAIYDHLLILKNRSGVGKASKQLLLDTRHEEKPDPIKVDMQFGDKSFKFVRRIPISEAVRQKLGRTDWTEDELQKELKRRKEDIRGALQVLEKEGLTRKVGAKWQRINRPI